MRNLTPLFYDVAAKVSPYCPRAALGFRDLPYSPAANCHQDALEGRSAESRHTRMDGPHCARACGARGAGPFLRSAHCGFAGRLHGSRQSICVGVKLFNYFNSLTPRTILTHTLPAPAPRSPTSATSAACFHFLCVLGHRGSDGRYWTSCRTRKYRRSKESVTR